MGWGGTGGGACTAPYISSLTPCRLQVLCLTGCGIESRACAAIAGRVVAGSRRLVELDLGFNDLVDVGPVSDALATNCSVRRLRLRGNAIDASGAAAIFASLRLNYRLQVSARGVYGI